MSKTSERVRIEWKAGDTVRDHGYRPENMDEKLPVIVNVHGGGWVYGYKDLYQFYAMSLAQRGL